MSDELNLELPPHVQFHSDIHLMVFRPTGIIDEAHVNSTIAFLEQAEDRADRPFNRFTDLSKADAIDLSSAFLFQVSLYRRLVYGKRSPVKSAFYVTSPAAARAVRIHALMTNNSPLQVAMFHEIVEAAAWLEVPKETLESSRA